MTYEEKKRKAALVAAAYYIEQERIEQTESSEYSNKPCKWKVAAKEISMNNRQMVQRRGRTFKRGA